ncbi:hypothetical protein WME95_33975 [Sorangium sp. So ce327]|uniref:hypothetical protein n=1 Tax=Sorangium sp. So ce327 TaxID=3133301 RepID=UPI003F5DCB6E
MAERQAAELLSVDADAAEPVSDARPRAHDGKEHVPGTLFRGADGELYFIPDHRLPLFRVFDTSRARVEPLLAEEPSKPAEDRSSARLKAVYTTIEIHDPRNADGSPAETDGIISASVRPETD